ncbi:MAG: protein kinase [Myxococcota bacterium]|jgi:serine/threonine-protein kinase|nr:protein kinase [Myxococcota bacterium]
MDEGWAQDEGRDMQGGSTFPPGTVLAGRFEIVRFVAAGGMGAIYEARQMPLKRKVALKVIRQELSQDRQLVARFEREAETVAQLTHSHTITLFDYGISPEGILFLAMEWLDGVDLGAEIRHVGRFEALRAARVAAQVARSLSEAHQLGVIHRDLKPENIFLIEREGQKDFVKVLDFGIVKPTDDARTQITRIGMVCGTPEFMSPEQARGERIDGRSDVYALGTVLYAMLSGRPPFQSESMLQVVMLHQATPFPELGPQVPEALKGIIRRATAKLPEERFASVAEMGEALETFVQGGSQADAAALASTAWSSPGMVKTAEGPGLVAPKQAVAVAPSLIQAPSLAQAQSLPRTASAPQTTQSAAPNSSNGLVKWLFLGLGALLLVGLGLGIAALILSKGADPQQVPAKAEGVSPDQSEAESQASPTPDATRKPDATLSPKPDVAPPVDSAVAVPPSTPDCEEGMERSIASDGNCCYPGQSWSDGRKACVGTPRICPSSSYPKGETCEQAAVHLAQAVRECNGGSYVACQSLCLQLDDLDQAAYFTEQLHRFAAKACEKQDWMACYHSAEGLMLQVDDESERRALELFGKSCDAGVSEACFAAFLYSQADGNASRMERFSKAYCLLEADGCEDGKPIVDFGAVFDPSTLPAMPDLSGIPGVSSPIFD